MHTPSVNIHNSTPALSARFFVADEVFNTWPKIAVLTSDGKFYCEYLDHMAHKTIEKHFVYDTFSETTFKFGKDLHKTDYQPFREVSRQEVLAYRLKNQENWVGQYLKSRRIL